MDDDCNKELTMDDDDKELAFMFREMNECDTVTLLRQIYPHLQDIVDNKV